MESYPASRTNINRNMFEVLYTLEIRQKNKADLIVRPAPFMFIQALIVYFFVEKKLRLHVYK